jgi:predicted dehydrogenase
MGVIGQWHARIIESLPQATLVAACDHAPERARSAADSIKPGLPLYGSLNDLLRHEDVDLITICTPSGNHLEPAITAMEAGKHVICEKPLEVSLDRIDRMIQTARERDVRLAGIFQNRWNPANRAIYDAVRHNRFGRLAWAGCFTPWYRSDEYYRSGGWRGTWKLDGGGAMMNQSIHAVDLLQWIMGPVETVSAYAGTRIHGAIEVEDTLSASLRFKSGALGTIMGSTAMYPGRSVRLEIGGEFGTAVAEDGLKAFQFKGATAADQDLVNRVNQMAEVPGGAGSQHLASMQNHTSNMQAIFAAWEENRDADTDGVEARKAVALVLAMYESAKAGGRAVLVE